MNDFALLSTYNWLEPAMESLAVLVDRDNYNQTPIGWTRKSYQLYCTTLETTAEGKTTLLVSISRGHCHVTIQRSDVIANLDEKVFLSRLKGSVDWIATITVIASLGNADVCLQKVYEKVVVEKISYSPEGMVPDMSLLAQNSRFVERICNEVHQRLFQTVEKILFETITEAKELREKICTTELSEKELERFWFDTIGDIPSMNTYLKDGTTVAVIDAANANMLINIKLTALVTHAIRITGTRDVIAYRSMLQEQIITKLSDNTLYLDELSIRYRFQ